MARVTLRKIHEALEQHSAGFGIGDMLKSDNLAGLADPAQARINLGVSSGAKYIHPQVTATTSWIINHNLGEKPNIVLINAAGRVFLGQIDHPTVNQAVVSLDIAVGGIARCT